MEELQIDQNIEIKSPDKKKNFIARTITASILAPLVIAAVYCGGATYQGLILIIAILMAFEWHTITSHDHTMSDSKQLMWKFIGVSYIFLPCISMMWMRQTEKGMAVTFWMLANVWCTDIVAYIVGSTVGGWKIYPKISPNKTWSGLIGAVIASAIVGYVAAILMSSSRPIFLVTLSAGLSIYAQLGDFAESWFKRKFDVKDSGHILPGHGGILDRVDGIVPVAPKVAFVLLFDKWGIF